VPKVVGFLAEMLLNGQNLVGVGPLLNDYAFNAPGLSHLEKVHRLPYVKWHYAMRHVVDMLLRLCNHTAAINQQENSN
jgi:hypothetical protein